MKNVNVKNCQITKSHFTDFELEYLKYLCKKFKYSNEIFKVYNERFYYRQRTKSSLKNKIFEIKKKYNLTFRSKIRTKAEKEKHAKLLLENIEKRPDNVISAIELTAKQLNCSACALRNQYYRELKDKHHVLSLSSKHMITNNVKVTHRVNGILPPMVNPAAIPIILASAIPTWKKRSG